MKGLTIKRLSVGGALVLLALYSVWGSIALAADAAASGADHQTVLSRWLAYLQDNFSRATWDYIMRWVNFAILAGIIVKYARRPLLNFLQDKKAETARGLKRFEAQKAEAEEKIREGQIRLEASKERLALIEERIISEGKKRKEQMIQDANEESRLMLAAARTRVDSQVQEVARVIKNEMIDAAVEIALQRLPKLVTDADQQRLLNLWMDEASREPTAQARD